MAKGEGEKDWRFSSEFPLCFLSCHHFKTGNIQNSNDGLEQTPHVIAETVLFNLFFIFPLSY